MTLLRRSNHNIHFGSNTGLHPSASDHRTKLSCHIDWRTWYLLLSPFLARSDRRHQSLHNLFLLSASSHWVELVDEAHNHPGHRSRAERGSVDDSLQDHSMTWTPLQRLDDSAHWKRNVTLLMIDQTVICLYDYLPYLRIPSLRRSRTVRRQPRVSIVIWERAIVCTRFAALYPRSHSAELRGAIR